MGIYSGLIWRAYHWIRMQQQAAESTKSDLAGRRDIRERRVADDAGEDLADVC